MCRYVQAKAFKRRFYGVLQINIFSLPASRVGSIPITRSKNERPAKGRFCCYEINVTAV